MASQGDDNDEEIKKEEDDDENEEVIVNVKANDECIKDLRDIRYKFISVGVELPLEITHFEHALRKLPKTQKKITDFF